MARIPPPPPGPTAMDIIPWVGMIIAGIGAVASAVAKVMTARAQIEAQQEMAKAAQEYWRNVGVPQHHQHHTGYQQQQDTVHN